MDLPILTPYKKRVCPTHLKRAIHRVNANPSLNKKIEHALALDNKDEFIKLIKNVSCPEDLPEFTVRHMFEYDSVECASAVLAGEIDHFDLKAVIIDYAWPPLHMAAVYGAYNLTSLFLNNGERTDLRIKYYEYYYHSRKALPLNVALCSIRSWPHMNSLVDDSVFQLVLTLSSPLLRHHMETLRLLAQRTKCIDQEVAGYFKERKLIEYAALLMVNCTPAANSLVGQHESKKSESAGMLLLHEVFEKIGDKLRAYLRIHRPTSVSNSADKNTQDIATLFRDAGLPLKSKYTCYRCNVDFPSSDMIYNPDNEDQVKQVLLGPEVEQALSASGHVFQGSGIGFNSKQVSTASRFNSQGFIRGGRAFHASSSLPKPDYTQLSTLAGAVPELNLSKGLRCFVTALRKGVGYL